MPLVLWLVIRILRALAATVRLLTSPRTLRALPWPYIRGRALRDRWTGLLVLTVPVTTLAALVVAAGPTNGIRFAAWTVALCAGGLGILSSWVRAVVDRPR